MDATQALQDGRTTCSSPTCCCNKTLAQRYSTHYFNVQLQGYYFSDIDRPTTKLLCAVWKHHLEPGWLGDRWLITDSNLDLYLPEVSSLIGRYMLRQGAGERQRDWFRSAMFLNDHGDRALALVVNVLHEVRSAPPAQD